MKKTEITQGLLAPYYVPLVYRKKAVEQLKRYRQGSKNYTRIRAKGKGKVSHRCLKIDIGMFWRLLSRNGGRDWEMMTHERYNNEIWK
ncbi:ParE family toxin-like protein [Photorhabdus laumondii]|uniref:ParE family toxin-like protein n=1 Tax=Photorhabdus laumondii TaxID=2218628 RepID=UPI0025AF8DAC|nr:hypothetical protein [Photorhabdus laumondii]